MIIQTLSKGNLVNCHFVVLEDNSCEETQVAGNDDVVREMVLTLSKWWTAAGQTDAKT